MRCDAMRRVRCETKRDTYYLIEVADIVCTCMCVYVCFSLSILVLSIYLYLPSRSSGKVSSM
jgi:hypothetical protein